MHTFKDKNDVDWELELNIGVIEEVKGKLEIDLLDPVNEEHQLLVDLSPINTENIMRFCKLLSVLCEEQCKTLDIPPATFLKLLNPTTLKSAYTAFDEEWQDFFQSLGRTDLAEAMKKMKELIKEGVVKVIVELEKIKYPTDNTSTNLQELSE